MNTITIKDSTHSKADKNLIPHISPCLRYQKEKWKQGRYRREKTIIPAYLIHRGDGIFLTGLLPKVTTFLRDKNVPFNIDFEGYEHLASEGYPHLDGIELRNDQMRLIKNCIDHQRGVILSPTRSGKTVVAMGLMSVFPKARILFLCNSIDIIDQTVSELEKYKFKDIAKLYGGQKQWRGKRIVVSTIQTFARLDPDEYCDYFDITIVDEAHHCIGRWDSTKKTVLSQYGQVMAYSLSPMKIGFTATLPTDKLALLSMEGLLGPVIGEVTQEESIELGITMKPIIQLIPVPYSPKIGEYRKYRDLYEVGIVNNRVRNKLVAKIIKEKIDEKMTVLVMVKEIDHGLNIQHLCEEIFGIDIFFVRGETDSETRKLVKSAFVDQHLTAVISTAVWREGVNIPSLNCTINAIGGKSEIMTLQAVGRGLTKWKGKKHAEIVDFLDPYKFLAEHSIARLSIYIENGWL